MSPGMYQFGLCKHLAGKAPLKAREIQSGAERFIPKAELNSLHTHLLQYNREI